MQILALNSSPRGKEESKIEPALQKRLEPETQAALSRDLAPREMLIRAANEEFSQIAMRQSNPAGQP